MSLTFWNSQGIRYLQMSMTPDQPQTERTRHKYDALGLIVLIFVACVLGIYMIASTVLISKDGVLYIEQAKLFERDSGTVLEGNTPGYPILLFALHKVVGWFRDNSSLFGWVYTAQGVTLLCRLLALVPLYLIGKRLVGRRNSFYAMLILILLPHPAHMSCELTREWPYVLFLATGLFLLLRGAVHTSRWAFGAAGLMAGLGYVIRPEGAQLVVFGVLWLLFRLARPGRNLGRARVGFALVALLIGFAIPVVPYANARGKIMPHKVRELLATSRESPPEGARPENSDSESGFTATAGVLDGVGGAIYELAERISENLLYVFVPPMLVGAYWHFRRRQAMGHAEKFFISAFVAFNVLAPILLYQYFHYMSRRHALPVVLLGVYYVPSGLRIISDRLERGIFRSRAPIKKNSLRWFSILLITGLAACLPKLLQPAGADKQGYRDAAEWLKNNTDTADVVAAVDPRISFYAERRGLSCESHVPEDADYVVIVTGSSGEATNPAAAAQEVYSVGISRREKNGKKVVIYRII